MNSEFMTNPNSYDAVKDNLTPLVEVEDIEDFEIDDTFNYDGFQVVRGEFFAHIFEPSLTFNNGKMSLNMACINKLPTIDYVLPLVNSKEKRIAIKPSSEDIKDAFMWCTYARKDNKRRPKQVTCKVFFHKIFDLMDWNRDYRYKILGKMIQSNGEFLFIFDLKNAETYQRIFKEGEKPITSRIPVFPAEWQNQFGLPYEEHKKSLQVNMFNGYTVFGIKNGEKKQDDIVSAAGDDTEGEQPITLTDNNDLGYNGGGYGGF